MAVTKTPTNYTLVFTSGFLAAYVLLVSHQSISSYMPSIDSVFSTATIASISSVLTSSSSTTDVDVEDQYRRALEESLGYFDDIPESKWMRRKDITLSYDHTEVVPPEGADDYNPNWYYKNWHPDFHCEFEDFVGDGGDGGKWICDPHRLLKKKDCLVYSVGSNGKFDFEQHVQMALPHCEIHIFDFTDYTSAMKAWGGSGVNASFHAWGLGSKDGAMNIKVSPGQKRPTFKSFRETVNELGHVGRSIDLFKIDCEGCEVCTVVCRSMCAFVLFFFETVIY